jgi:hypothetical protein
VSFPPVQCGAWLRLVASLISTQLSTQISTQLSTSYKHVYFMKRLAFWIITPCSSQSPMFWQAHLATCFCWFLAWLTLQPWRWRRYFFPKFWALSKSHSIASQKTALFIAIATRTPNTIYISHWFCPLSLHQWIWELCWHSEIHTASIMKAKEKRGGDQEKGFSMWRLSKLERLGICCSYL